MEVNDLQSGRDLNFRVELTNLDLCANFHLPSFSRDFRAPDLNFLCKWMPKNVREKATPPSHGDIFADVVHNDAFESDENEMEEKTENKYADL